MLMSGISFLNPGDYVCSLTVEGLEREYRLHIPPVAREGGELPVVLALHGGGSNAEQMIAFCGLNAKADREGFLAVYPNGAGRTPRARSWNAGNCCGYAQRHGVDDVKFIGRVLDDLAAATPIDVSRIYATGMSNGAMMCYRLASEMADRLAGIAPVAGPMGTKDCTPSRPIPVCHFHGVGDQFAPYHGGLGGRSLSRTNFYSVEHTIARWVMANRCQGTPEITDLPAPIDDGTRITRTHYRPGEDGAEVVLYTIHGAGHTWPGRHPTLKYLGRSTSNLSANDVMWEFFTQ